MRLFLYLKTHLLLVLKNSPEFWQNCWYKHLAEYQSYPPFAGIFIKGILKNKIKCILEIGCGSSGDSIYLANKDYKVTAVDNEENIIRTLKNQNNNHLLYYQVADAFSLPFENDRFDLVFHNGFFVYFSNDEIIKLLKEQERIAKKYILIFVHNKSNIRLLEQFNTRSINDKLYDLRFFYPKEIKEIVRTSGIPYKSISILKFEGPMNRFANKYFVAKLEGKKRIFRFFPNFMYYRKEFFLPRLYQFQRWKNTVRIACLIELNK